MTSLSIVFGFRDRDVQRVERCLASLGQQTFTDFEVLFVDYGSQPQTARAVRKVVEEYPFARYIYTETRGYAWNRSHALNIGGKQATGEYLMTTDVDMMYMPDFLDVFMAHTAANLELHMTPYMLPQHFSDWHKLDSYRGKLERGHDGMLGACQVIATRIFREMRGYDEYYRYYGVEDRDINIRLRLLGIEERRLIEETAMFHQWHPIANYNVRDLLPEGVMGRMETHFQRYQHEIVRNNDAWGKLHTYENRPVLRFVDMENQTLHDCTELHILNLPPTQNQSIGTVSATFFYTLQSSHALAINNAFFPKYTEQADFLRRWTNRLVYRISHGTLLDYPTNKLHNFVVNFVEPPAVGIADYYLNLPVMNGVNVIVKS